MSDFLSSEDFFDQLRENGANLDFTETTVYVEFRWIEVTYPRMRNYPHAELKILLDKIPPLARLL